MSLDTSPAAAAAPAATAGHDVAAGNAAAIAAIRGHHRQLADDLQRLTAAVVDGVDAGVAKAERDRLHEWYETELIPHARAEEGTLYRAGADLPEAGLLVRAMIDEHHALIDLVDELAHATHALTMATVAAAAHAVFAIHLIKENDLLLPALDAAGFDIGGALAGMHEILGGHGHGHEHGHGHGHGAAATVQDVQIGHTPPAAGPPAEVAELAELAEGDLDVRTLPHGARHEIIFGRLHELEPGEALVIVNDHDPKPLRYQTEAMWPDQFVWTYLAAGPEVWRVSISRADV